MNMTNSSIFICTICSCLNYTTTTTVSTTVSKQEQQQPKPPIREKKTVLTAKKTPKKAAGKGKAPPDVAKTKQKPAPKGKLVPLSAIPHPKYGLKFECFECETRFYLMGKPEPVCPCCGVDQRERPKEAKKETTKTKRPAVRPMAPLLDDDEEVATPETTKQREPGDPDAMFDDAEVASVAEDTDEAPSPKPATEKGDDG